MKIAEDHIFRYEPNPIIEFKYVKIPIVLKMLKTLVEVAECRLLYDDSMDRKYGLEHDVKRLIEEVTGETIEKILEGESK